MTSQHLSPSIFRYRVMRDDQTIGQFTNLALAERTACDYPGSVVVNVSVQPAKLVYKDGKLLEQEGR